MEFLEKNRPDVEVHPHTLSTELLVRVASKMEAFEVRPLCNYYLTKQPDFRTRIGEKNYLQ